MDEFIGEFVADTRDGFERIRADLAIWENDPANGAALEALFRFVHTVRGNCGFLKFERFERLCVPAELAMVAAREDKQQCSPDQVKAICEIIARIGGLAAAIEEGRGLSAIDELRMVAALGLVDYRPPEAATKVPRASKRLAMVRLSTDQFDELMQSIEGLEQAHRDLLDVISHLNPPPSLSPAMFKLASAIATTSDSLSRCRTQGLETLRSGLERLVHQTAQSQGKAAGLALSGGALLVDREIIDALRDCLVHVIRNAIDHGLEMPEERIGLGKDAAGLITMQALQNGAFLTIRIEDDGSGADMAALGVSDNQALLDRIAKPGFSTARAGSTLSGKGVGLDAVRDRIEQLGGTLEADQQPGCGLALILTIPNAGGLRDVA